MDTTIKVTTIHVIGGLISAFISLGISVGWFGFKNDVFAGILPFIILYFIGQACQKRYNDEISGFSQWLWDGISPFLFTWIISFVVLYNYMGFL
ncbi:MAG: hypothetical protein Q4P18_04670 [Methanobrevibacter sp.]|uniref:EMC6-like membrane protein n=1 Tax=Methanobrevibacter sp. TaxID=66852 RepID=UPI0026DFE256|nr:hypothetical protein [Methanobrevibacter sp.]MDO5848806.1 hypothetical protein [Methanobrevibacter sp.]